MSNLSPLVTKLLSKGVHPKDIVGCSTEDISVLQDSTTLRLPQDYLNAMSSFGRKAGDLFKDSIFFFPEILGHNEEVKDYLSEVGEIPKSFFCFFNNQNSYLAFIDTEESSDRRVYQWHDGNPSNFRRLSTNLDGVLLKEINALAPKLR